MAIWIEKMEDILYDNNLLWDLILSEKWFTFPDKITSQSFWKKIEKIREKIREIDWYKNILLKWINWWIWNNIMELSWKNINEINEYIKKEYENTRIKLGNIWMDLDGFNENISLLEMSKNISFFRKKIEIISWNPVCLQINAIDKIDIKHSWTIYTSKIIEKEDIEIDEKKLIIELLNDLKKLIWCDSIFIVLPKWELYWDMWDVWVVAKKIWIARQKSQRKNQNKSTISRTALPYFADWPDTKVFSKWHNKWNVASLIRVPIEINWKWFDLKLTYKEPVYFENWEIAKVLEYAKVIEKLLPNWINNIKCIK